MLVSLAGRFSELDPTMQTVIVAVAGLAAAIGPVLMVVGTLMTALGPLAIAIGALVSPVGLVVLAVAGLAAAWATDFGGIREKTAAVWEFLQGVFAGAQAMMQPLLDALGGVVDFVRTVFSGSVLDIAAKIGDLARPAAGGGKAFAMLVATIRDSCRRDR